VLWDVMGLCLRCVALKNKGQDFQRHGSRDGAVYHDWTGHRYIR
jgi:hypothetical protein